MNRVDPTLLATFMAAALASLGMAGLAWRRRRNTPGGMWLVIVLCAIAEILGAYGLSYGAVFTPAQKVWLINITYAGWLLAPPALAIYVARVTGREGWLRPVTWAVMVAVPLAFVPVIWGPWAPAAFFGGGRSEQTFEFPASSPLYVVFIFYLYILLAVSAVLVMSTVRSTGRLHPLQAVALIVMVVVPWVMSLGSFVNKRIFDADPTVVSLVIVAFMAFALTQFRTFDLRPMTQAEAQLASDAGVVVIDDRGRLSEMNATAARLLGPGVSPAMGLQIEQIWAREPGIVAALHGADLGGIAVPSASADSLLAFEYAPMRAANGRRTGTLILIREQEGAGDA